MTGVTRSPPDSSASDDDAGGHEHHHDDGPGDDRDAARDDPPAALQRSRQQHVEPAGCLVGRPIGNEGRRRETRKDQPEFDERQFEEATDRSDVHAREELVEEALEFGRLVELLDERPS